MGATKSDGLAGSEEVPGVSYRPDDETEVCNVDTRSHLGYTL